jgi:hypothetical protein
MYEHYSLSLSFKAIIIPKIVLQQFIALGILRGGLVMVMECGIKRRERERERETLYVHRHTLLTTITCSIIWAQINNTTF